MRPSGGRRQNASSCSAYIEHAAGAVRVRVASEGEHATIDVHNDGLPIPAQLLDQLFEPFRQGEQNGAGMGLGLYIVHEIVRAHQGTIAVTSTADGGTDFIVRLPRTSPEASAPVPDPG